MSSHVKLYKTSFIPIKFSHKFLWHNATAFDFAVVPDVNNISVISSGFISASINAISPSSINFLPFCINSLNEYTPSLFSFASIDIKCFNFVVPSFANFFNIGSYFSE